MLSLKMKTIHDIYLVNFLFLLCIQTIELLTKSGASIDEMNAIRQCLSQVKGGKLAAAAYPAKVQFNINIRIDIFLQSTSIESYYKINH